MSPIRFPTQTMFPQSTKRVGLSLVELMMAMVIVSGLMLALSGLSSAVQNTSFRNKKVGSITQHARVAIQRITRKVEGAVTSPVFPGLTVLSETQEGWDFPDVLIVWSPESGIAAEPASGPRVGELVLTTWNRSAPNELLEITDRADSSVALTSAELASWQSSGTTTAWERVVQGMMASNTGRQVVLTDRLRIASAASWTDIEAAYLRGCVRFHTNLRPSQAEWNAYQASTLAWSDLSWAMGIRGSTRGLRRVVVWFEVQLDPTKSDEKYSSTEIPPVPFFGSASLSYQLEQ